MFISASLGVMLTFGCSMLLNHDAEYVKNNNTLMIGEG